MATISEAEINDLAARTRALELQAPAPLDIDSLPSNSRDITPPIDQDEWDADTSDVKARQDLINDGCPPCHPPHIEVPVRNPEYQSIISYWKPFPMIGSYWEPESVDGVMCAQRSDWREFREYQTRERARYRERKFHRYVERATEMRRRHGLAGDVRFLFKKELQSQLETWIEYQHYHLMRHEKLEWEREREREWERDEFASCQEGVIPSTDSPHKILPKSWLGYALEESIARVEHHNILLEWTEQQRLAMEAAPGLPATWNLVIASRALRKTPARASRASRAVLGKAGVSKTAPTKRGAPVLRPPLRYWPVPTSSQHGAGGCRDRR